MDITVSDFQKGRDNLIIYVGIDIAKLNLFASAIYSDGEILMEPFKFINDGDGFQLLASKLKLLEPRDDSLIIGLESTAHYVDNLERYLVASDFKVCMPNPIKTSTIRKNNIRKTKTDKVDTYIISKTLIMQDSYRFITSHDLNLIDLKQLGRFRQKTIKQQTRLKIQLTSYVDQVFPDLQYFFKIWTAPKICLRPLKRNSDTAVHCFHAYDSPKQPSCKNIARPLYKGAGKRVKNSRTEVCR